MQEAVSKAAQLLFFNPAKFSIPITSDQSVSHPRMVLSAQFSEIAPKVISYDPEKPIKPKQRDSSTHLAQRSRFSFSSVTGGQVYRQSDASLSYIAQPLEVSSLHCIILNLKVLNVLKVKLKSFNFQNNAIIR